MLSKEIIREFTDIVGERNISTSLAVLETYRCAAAQNSAHYGPYDHRTPMPAAVILPGSTEEVSAVIKVCNKYKIKYKASTTFWSSHGYVANDDAVQLDMRRMSNLSIDPKNMTMTVEPYVIAATAQAEALKYGLTCCVPGVGASSAIVPNTIGWMGGGPTSIYTGPPSENLICAEWVLPTGEVIQTGSAGAGDGWFCGDGPGFSQRAIFRGGHGTTSDMGVCTRISFKLSPWAGPAVIPSEGPAGAYRAKMPDNFKFYCLCFPTWKDWGEAVMDLCDSDAIFMGHRQFSMFGKDIEAAMLEILIDPDKQLCDIPALVEDPEVKKFNESMKIEMNVILQGMTEKDLEWKELAIDAILEKNGGWKNERCQQPDMNEWMMMYFLRMGHKNLNYALCGSYEGHFGLAMSSVTKAVKYCEEAFALKKEWEEKDTFMARVGGDATMGAVSCEGGGSGSLPWEFFAHFDAHDKESIRKTCEYFEVTNKWQLERGLGPDFGKSNGNMRRPDGYGYTQEQHNEIFSQMPNPLPFIYQYKLREAYNPNNLASSYYQTLDPAYLEKNKA